MYDSFCVCLCVPVCLRVSVSVCVGGCAHAHACSTFEFQGGRFSELGRWVFLEERELGLRKVFFEDP
jgi:hypothetical protein